VATDDCVSFKEMTRNAADDADATSEYMYRDKKEFTYRNLQVTAKADNKEWALALRTIAERKASTKFLSYNAALHYPFNARREDLEKVSHSLNFTVPVPLFPTGKTELPTLMHYFGVEKDIRWISSIMDSLNYEAKFFKGRSTLGDIGIETGENILCISSFKLKADELDEGWFQSLNLEDDGHSVYTKMEGVTDGDLAIANYTATVSNFEGGHANSFVTLSRSVQIPTNVPAGNFDPYSSHTRRIIRDAPLIAHRFHTMLKSEMLLKLSDVIGV